MARRHRRPQREVVHVLDQFTARDVVGWLAYHDHVLQYHWDYFAALAHQRAKAEDRIRAALRSADRGPFEFEEWQRVVRWRWSLQPLSSRGSVRNDEGGRFNIGEIDPKKFSPFPALYLCEDKETAIQEVICNAQSSKDPRLSPLDLALADPDSTTNVSAHGRLESHIDLDEPHSLKKFIKVISGFILPDHLAKTAKALKIPAPGTVTTANLLLDTIYQSDWRQFPAVFDVPANSQLFGQLVRDAGIEAIRYRSKFTKKPCLAIFPDTFAGSDSFVEITDEAPRKDVIRRLDRETWERLV